MADKQKFRVIGIDRKKGKSGTFEEYSKQIEGALNDMVNTGYDIVSTDVQKKGALIVGHLSAPNSFVQQLTDMGFIAAPQPPSPPEEKATELKYHKSKQIIAHVLRLLDSHDRTKHSHILDEFAKDFIKHHPVDDAMSLASDLEKVAVEHEQHHGGREHTECEAPLHLKKLADLIKAKGHLNLQ